MTDSIKMGVDLASGESRSVVTCPDCNLEILPNESTTVRNGVLCHDLCPSDPSSRSSYPPSFDDE